MQIKACAGSGKTTTILCRVKHLIEIEKVHPERILITAFNVDAAKSVKTKLAAMMSEKIEKLVHVNNIDKLSRQWVI
jgi:DNA helicase-2/ATP-dependent DNA helicase PcrA